MFCQICQKNPMTMKIIKLEHGVPTEFNVCEECASQVSTYHAKLKKHGNLSKQQEDLQDLLKKLIAQGGTTSIQEVGDESAESVICPNCGLSLHQYRQTYMLGCPMCYDAFGDQMMEDLERIHGSTEHVDQQRPVVVHDKGLDLQARVRILHRELAEAIGSEDFDTAARLRDEIRKMEQSLTLEKEN